MGRWKGQRPGVMNKKDKGKGGKKGGIRWAQARIMLWVKGRKKKKKVTAYGCNKELYMVVPGARQRIVVIKSKGRISDLQLSKRKRDFNGNC